MGNPNEFRADVIEVTVSGGFKTEHLFNAADGLLGILNLNAMISEGLFRGADGSELNIKRTSFWRSTYQLSDGSSIVGAVKPLKKLSRAFVIDYEGQTMRLAPGGSKFRSWKLLDAAENPLCELMPRKALKRGARIRIQAPAALGLLAVAYTLVARRWQEESSAAA
jgi:hypothetical protein